MKKTVVIIGAGPAGLTAALELLRQEGDAYHPIILEATEAIGGISQTVRYNGNRIDIGGHRFFSKSDQIMQWWQEILPIQGAPAIDDRELNREIPVSTNPEAPDPEKEDRLLLVRSRLSRILFLRKFFNYPISLSKETLLNLGAVRVFKIGMTYLQARIAPRKPEVTLEDFFINRFGKELYKTFFRDYTEKVWGVPCDKIQAAWGAQRVKGLSVSKAILHALKKVGSKPKDIAQKGTETSLIEQFLYPKFGPGQMWESVADEVQRLGGEIHKLHRVVELSNDAAGGAITEVVVTDPSGATRRFQADYVISTMPIKELVNVLETPPQGEVKEIADNLLYRDFLTVGLLLKQLKIANKTDIPTVNNLVPDNWIYIQEPDVDVGRLQIFNNWSPYMVADRNLVWMGLEYFCNEGDRLWNKPDEEMRRYAIEELAKIGVIDPDNVLDGVVIRVPKAYPAYFGSYDRFDTLREYLDQYQNLFLVGRNGMHRYNNMDHSMLAAMEAVSNIRNGITDKSNLWEVNTEKEYHEKK